MKGDTWWDMRSRRMEAAATAAVPAAAANSSMGDGVKHRRFPCDRGKTLRAHPRHVLSCVASLDSLILRWPGWIDFWFVFVLS